MLRTSPQLRLRGRFGLVAVICATIAAAVVLALVVLSYNPGRVTPTTVTRAPKPVALCILSPRAVNRVITITGGLTAKLDILGQECDYSTRSGWQVVRVSNLGPSADNPGEYRIPGEHYTNVTIDGVPVRIGHRGPTEGGYDAYLTWGGNQLWVYYTQNWASETSCRQLVTILLKALNGANATPTRA